MFEEGRVSVAGEAGGRIIAVDPSPVFYIPKAVQGPMPRRTDKVCFLRDDNDPQSASSVRVGSCAAAALAVQLEAAFHAQLGQAQLTDSGHAEVQRMSSDRAARILRRLPDGNAADAVMQARLALATAAMQLMATETATLVTGPVSEQSLRAVLRGQRPRLPR